MAPQPEPGSAASCDTAPRLSRGAVLALAAAALAFGAAAAAVTIATSGVLELADAAASWPLSALLVGLVAALWFAGISLACLFAATGLRRPRRLNGWLAAFGLAPFAAALFFFLIGVGGNAPAVGYLAVAAILCLAVLARRLLSEIAEKLLVAFFLWLGLLVAPVLWRDPVNEAFSSALLAMLRASGVIA